MHPTLVRSALHKHVPLIKFLGPRSKLAQEHLPAGTMHPCAPDNIIEGNPRSSPKPTAASQVSKQTQAQALDWTDLPTKYTRRGLSNEEIEAIELGGATIIY
ncbi:uncharacterized protein VTP21DRAFT_1436 [Calcarisporiella thermophila]|uniref:uncharacterized protein n=1 Tax=Calcarisporiella thermophila TaxID=911321 RepID=UPI0037433720